MVVVICVAAEAGVWRVVVITIVTSRTVIGDAGVGTVQLVIIIVNIK